MKTTIVLIPVGLAAAQGHLSAQLFRQNDCPTNGTILADVTTNDGNAHDSSNCQSFGQFSSVFIVSADPGFQCNLYSDTSCQNYITTITQANTCSNTIGQSIVCFNQNLFDNPLAESTATVTLGQTNAPVLFTQFGISGAPPDPLTGVGQQYNLVKAMVAKACSSTGCDPTATMSSIWGFHHDHCSQSVKMTGFFPDANNRDYMAEVLANATQRAAPSFTFDFQANEDPNVAAEFAQPILTFIQIEMSDAAGNNKAQMTMEIDAQCSPGDSGCNSGSLLATITSTFLSLIPDVGGLLAGAFNVACAADS